MSVHKVYCDGGIRTGLMAYGYLIYDEENNLIKTGSRTCGKDNSSSNIAEYRALIASIHACKNLGIDYVDIYMDSQLVVRQITGEYKVNKKELKEHNEYAKKILGEFVEWKINWIPRTKNKEADKLVNEVFMKRFNNKKGKR